MNLNLDFAGFGQPRGLYNFISEIRNAKSKDDERSRVDQELANIRLKFSAAANLSSYQKKKYVWKLCYIYMLGYEVDFGHLEFISLLSSTKFQEKSVGYMALSMMLRPGDELMTLVINSMRNDVIGQIHHGQTLALAAVSNIGGNDLAEALSSDVQRVIVSSLEGGGHFGGLTAEQEVRHKTLLAKKASLCLLRLFRTNPDCVNLDEWMKRLARMLEDRDLGVVCSVMSLLLGFASSSTTMFEPLVPYVISVLNRLVVSRTCASDYLYYRTPSPWLQVKCLRFLQYYKIPSDATQIDLLNDILSKILVKTDQTDSNNKSNADHSILFEAINLVISYGPEAPTFLKEHACVLLGRFIAVKDANIRYLGLDAMTRLAKTDGPETCQEHLSTVMESLRDTDYSVRKRALNLIYVLTDDSNAHDIVGDLVTNLNFADSTLKEDMVVKIAILAEKFATDYQWYVQTMVQVILLAGDFVAEAVWFRIVQIVTNNADIHEFAAEKLLETVQSKFAHETIVALAAYLLGEIGVNVCEKPNMTGYDQFTALHQHFTRVSLRVQAILLTTYMKLLNLYPEETREVITAVFEKYATSSYLELQQRSCEYLALPTISSEIMETVLNTMPVYELDESKNILLTMGAAEAAGSNSGADRAAWNVSSSEKQASREAHYQAKQAQSANFKPDNRDLVDNAPVGGRPQSTARPAPAPAAKVVDLLSMDDDDTPASSASSGLNPTQQAQVTSALLKAELVRGMQTRSTLFDNELITVSVSQDYRAHQGRVVVFFNNKSNYNLDNFAATLAHLEALKVQQQDPSRTIVPFEESKMQISIDCMRPFNHVATPLALEVSFSLQGSTYRYPLTLPVTALSFSEPLPCDKATYMQRWQAITGEGTEAQLVFSAAKPVDPNALNFIRSVLVPAMNLGLAEGLDNEKTVTGCLTFTTGTLSGDGKPAVVGALMRLEGDPNNNKYRVTVRSKQAAISAAIKDYMVAHLGTK